MKDALLIIDMQNQWIRPDKAIYPSGAQAIANIQKLRKHFNDAGNPVFHIFITHESNGSDMRAGEKVFNVKGSHEAEIVAELRPTSSELLIPKTRLSGFFGTSLLKVLREKGVEGIAVTGLELRACVMATYIDAYQFDFRPVAMISDAVLDRNESYINHFLEAFRGEDFLMTTEEWISK